MSTTFSTTCGFGPTKTGLTPTVELCQVGGTVVDTKTGAHIANGEYVAALVAPVGFSYGYVKWTPGDGSRVRTEPVNLAQAAANVSVNLDGVGAYVLTVTVQDDASTPAPVPNAVVSVRTQSGNVAAWGITDADGEKHFHLDPDVYELIVTSRPGYDTPDPVEVTVVSADLVATVTMPLQSSTTPPTSGLTEVRFLVRKAGVPVEGAFCRAQLIKGNQGTIDDAILSLQVCEAETGADGKASLFLPDKDQYDTGNGVYRFTVVDADADGNEKVMSKIDSTVPAQSVVQYEDLVKAKATA